MKLFFSNFWQLVSEKYRPGEPRYFSKALKTRTAFGTRRRCQKAYPFIKVARYSFSGPIPPKFEHKLRRHKQSVGKIATTVVLDEDKNLLWSRLQRHQSCHSNELTLLPILLAEYISALGTVLQKSFTGVFSSNSRLDVREV